MCLNTRAFLPDCAASSHADDDRQFSRSAPLNARAAPPPQVSLRLRGGGLAASAQSCLSGNGFRGRDRAILTDVGGAVMPGELMGLIGGTGAGKSSLVRDSSLVCTSGSSFCPQSNIIMCKGTADSRGEGRFVQTSLPNDASSFFFLSSSSPCQLNILARRLVAAPGMEVSGSVLINGCAADIRSDAIRRVLHRVVLFVLPCLSPSFTSLKRF